MKQLHFDCSSGISGDMVIGAFLDLGVPFDYLKEGLSRLRLEGEYTISHTKQEKSGIAATKFNVTLIDKIASTHEHHHTHQHHPARNLADINQLIEASGLPEQVQSISKGIFALVAEAEAQVHNKPVDAVHFHEVGAVDSIVDIVGCALCVDYLKPACITASPLTDGCGTVRCAHGILPVPAPATAQIAKRCNVPIRLCEEPHELVTPTGMAIAAYLCKRFGTPDGSMRISGIGYGAGSRTLESRPNVLRILCLEPVKDPPRDCILIETNIDDMPGELFGYAMERLFQAGALDVFFSPIYMKKNRPAYQLSVLCSPDKTERMEQIIFAETTAIGVRKTSVARTMMEREHITLCTPYGEIGAKRSHIDGITTVKPDYDAVCAAARAHRASVREVYRNAIQPKQEEPCINNESTD